MADTGCGPRRAGIGAIERPHLVFPQVAFLLRPVEIDYCLTPEDAIRLLPKSDPEIAKWPKNKMHLWNGCKKEVIEKTTLPFLWNSDKFFIDDGRIRQRCAKIGFALPCEIASLAMESNEPEATMHTLSDLGIRYVMAIRESDDELWLHNERPWTFYLDVKQKKFGLAIARYSYTKNSCHHETALAGSPGDYPRPNQQWE